MRTRALIAAGIAGMGLLLTAGCSSSEPSSQELEQARQEGEDRARVEAAREAELLRLQEEVAELEAQGDKARAKAKKAEAEAKKAEAEARDQANTNSGGGGRALSGPQTECVDYVFAGATTSCSFAMNVAGEYGSNPGASRIQAYSPETGLSYSLTCSPYSGGGTVCVTDTGASVYLG